MEYIEIFIGTIVTILTTAIGYGFKKYIDLNSEMKLIKIEINKIQIKHGIESISKIHGYLFNIFHAVMHVNEGDFNYKDIGKNYCMELRKESRDSADIFSTEFVNELRGYTDKVIAYLESPNDELLKIIEPEFDEIIKLLFTTRENIINMSV